MPKGIDAAEIAPGLYMGSAPEPGSLPGVDVLVLTAREYQPAASAFPNVGVIRVLLDDSGGPFTTLEKYGAQQAAIEVAKQLKAGQRVLVTCQMGLNRSGMVAALALCYRYGTAPEKAIKRVRERRSPVFRKRFPNSNLEPLFNQQFIAFIEAQK